MYNGIGLQTARGSGTNGYVQSNKFLVRARSSATKPFGGSAPPPGPSITDGVRKPNKDILEHDRKRQIEVKLLVLRETLEERGYTEQEVEERIGETRKVLEAEAEAEKADAEGAGAGRSHGAHGASDKR
jgi:serine/arginine repetitive matrix protein 2